MDTEFGLTTGVLPASAGMIPVSPVERKPIECAPLIRGDDPSYSVTFGYTHLCSPHPRG